MTIEAHAIRFSEGQLALACAQVGGTNVAAAEAATRLLNDFADQLGLGARRIAEQAKWQEPTLAQQLAFSDAGQEQKEAPNFDARKLVEGLAAVRS